MDLTSCVAVVTGGHGLYGEPISEALAEAGAHVVIAARSVAACEELAARLLERGLSASVATYDQADEQSILSLRDELVNRYGAVQILVNNSVRRSMRAFH